MKPLTRELIAPVSPAFETRTVSIKDLPDPREDEKTRGYNVRNEFRDWDFESLALAMEASTPAEMAMHPDIKVLELTVPQPQLRKTKLRILQGYRRAGARWINYEKYLDEKTGKSIQVLERFQLPNGTLVEKSLEAALPPGVKQVTFTKDWSRVEVEVYRNLSPREEAYFLLDSGNRKELERDEVINACWRLADQGYDEASIVFINQGLLNKHFKRGARENSSHRPTVQGFMRAYTLPDNIRIQYLKKQAFLESYPTDQEVRDMATIMKEEREASVDGSVNRVNPGPKLIEFWEDIVARHSGKTRTRSVAAMSKRELKKVLQNLTSSTLTVFMRSIMRAKGYRHPGLVNFLNEWASTMESKFSEEEMAEYTARLKEFSENEGSEMKVRRGKKP